MYRRRSYPRAAKRPAYPATYRKKRRPARLKPAQSRYERSQPTAVTRRTAAQVQLYQTPIWPKSKLIYNQLYYDHRQTLNGLAGVVASRVYTANGVYDPDITGTGHQAMGFDQLMAAYEHYAVIRSKITVTFVNNGQQAIRCGVYLMPDTTALTLPEDIMENGLIKTITCDAKGTTGTGDRVHTVSLDCDVKSYFGKSKYNNLLEEKYTGSVTANPAEQVYFAVFTYGPYSNDNTVVFYDAVISYDVIYFEPRKLTAS